MRKVRWYCDFCGLGAREEIPGQMDDFALTTPRGAAICTSCANRELKSGQTLMQCWKFIRRERAQGHVSLSKINSRRKGHLAHRKESVHVYDISETHPRGHKAANTFLCRAPRNQRKYI